MDWVGGSAVVLAALNLGVVWFYSARLEKLTRAAHRAQTIWEVAAEMAPLRFLDVQLARVEQLVKVLKSGTRPSEWNHEIVALDAAVREVLTRTSVRMDVRPTIARLSDAVRYVMESTQPGEGPKLAKACEQFLSFAALTRSAISSRTDELETLERGL